MKCARDVDTTSTEDSKSLSNIVSPYTVPLRWVSWLPGSTLCVTVLLSAGEAVIECLSSWTNSDGVMYVFARRHSSTNTRPPTCQVSRVHTPLYQYLPSQLFYWIKFALTLSFYACVKRTQRRWHGNELQCIGLGVAIRVQSCVVDGLRQFCLLSLRQQWWVVQCQDTTETWMSLV